MGRVRPKGVEASQDMVSACICVAYKCSRLNWTLNPLVFFSEIVGRKTGPLSLKLTTRFVYVH